MLIRTRSPVENRLCCDTVWGFFSLFSNKLIQISGSFFLLTSIDFILMLLWYDWLYLLVISWKKWIYFLLLFLVNNLNMIPLTVRFKYWTILAFWSENVVKNLIWYGLKKFCRWEFKNSFLWLVLINLLDLLDAHPLDKQPQDMFEKFDVKAYV